MCPRDDSHLTIEFNDHYVIKPGIKFFSRNNGFQKNALGEEGNMVSQGFEYNSGDNPHFLNTEEISEYNHMASMT
ncbi:MAG: hypothetical protein ABR542_10385 [Desulfonatronovibrio sp.]